MRRANLEIKQVEAWDCFDHSMFSTLACVDKIGNPYMVSLSCARIEDVIYFHCAKEGKKIDLLRSHPNVCLTCNDHVEIATDKFTVYFRSCFIEGTIEFIEDKDEKIAALRVISEKYTPNMMKDFDHALKSLDSTEVVAIHVTSITGKEKRPSSHL